MNMRYDETEPMKILHLTSRGISSKALSGGKYEDTGHRWNWIYRKPCC